MILSKFHCYNRSNIVILIQPSGHTAFLLILKDFLAPFMLSNSDKFIFTLQHMPAHEFQFAEVFCNVFLFHKLWGTFTR